jgi:hypothetical protein
LEIHHIVHREHGGSHEASNLILCCSACHGHHHAGRIAISGTADQLDVTRLVDFTPTSDIDGQYAHGARESADALANIEMRRAGARESASDDQSRDGQTNLEAPRANRCDSVTASSKLDEAITLVHAKKALMALGWKAAIARPAVESAIAVLGADAPLDKVIFEALRRCPRPIVGGT